MIWQIDDKADIATVFKKNANYFLSSQHNNANNIDFGTQLKTLQKTISPGEIVPKIQVVFEPAIWLVGGAVVQHAWDPGFSFQHHQTEPQRPRKEKQSNNTN